MRLYLAGPMRGIPLFNFPAFEAAALSLRLRGHTVWSPAEHDIEQDGFDPAKDEAQPLSYYMERDLPEVCKCDALAMLPGWEKSKGATLEVMVGRKLGKPILDADTLRVIEIPNRKAFPVARGVLDYFPDAIMAVANVSFVSNEQHNPGEPMHWAREKSNDHADCIGRHLIQRGKLDEDGLRHTAKVAWRALALLQLELEAQ